MLALLRTFQEAPRKALEKSKVSFERWSTEFGCTHSRKILLGLHLMNLIYTYCLTNDYFRYSMVHPHASGVTFKSLLYQLYYIKRGSPVNIEYLLLTILNSFLVIFLPVFERKFRDAFDLSPQIEREDGVLTYLASKLMYVTYPA